MAMIVTMKYTSGGPGSWNHENKTFALIDNGRYRENRRYFWLDLDSSSFEPGDDGFVNYDDARNYMFKKASRLDMGEFNLENISLNTYLSRIKHPEEKDDEE